MDPVRSLVYLIDGFSIHVEAFDLRWILEEGEPDLLCSSNGEKDRTYMEQKNRRVKRNTSIEEL